MISDTETRQKNDCVPSRISINGDDIEGHEKPSTPRSSSGWDGKSRIDKKSETVSPEPHSEDGVTDDEKIIEGETIAADEGM